MSHSSSETPPPGSRVSNSAVDTSQQTIVRLAVPLVMKRMATSNQVTSAGRSNTEVDLYASAFLIRAFEERLLRLFAEGSLFGTVHTCIGQEFTGVAVAAHAEPGDLIFSNHRCHGHYLARTGDAFGLMAEVMGRTSGICQGRGGSQHICAAGVFSNGIQGGILPVSAGLAFAQKYQQTGNIVIAFIGDGTLGEGVVYETMNIASKWDVPLLIVLENNGYSQSTSQRETLAGEITLRAEAFAIETYRGDTWTPEELVEMMGRAMHGVRERSRPALFQIDTYRLMAHSKGDDDRPKEEVKHYWSLDPLTRYAERYPESADKLKADAERKISLAVEAAAAAPLAGLDAASEPSTPAISWERTEIQGKERAVSRIYQALREQLASNSQSLMLGEDIEGPYGGAFKVTRDLSLLFPGRVRNTPISEAALVGIGNGLAIAGLHPICEIMFGDFLTLAADQWINHAAKFRWMYGDQVSVPLIVRTPMGGRRGYGATHSQSLEKHFLGLPGTRVLALHSRYDPYLLYTRLFETVDRPTLVVENKVLYGDYVSHQVSPGFWCEHSDEDFPTTRIRSSENPDITIVCYGGSLPEVEKALDALFEDHEVIAEIICPTQIYPLQVSSILASVKVSKRLLVVEEGQLSCGFGAEVIALVSESCQGLPPLTRRLGAAPHPLPSCKPAEIASLPAVHSIVSKCVEMMHHD